jgi:hypothetical protein
VTHAYWDPDEEVIIVEESEPRARLYPLTLDVAAEFAAKLASALEGVPDPDDSVGSRAWWDPDEELIVWESGGVDTEGDPVVVGTLTREAAGELANALTAALMSVPPS